MNKLIITTDYYANVGRKGVNFYYLHNADSNYRIDPSASNIMDTYILTKAYDSDYRTWLLGDLDTEPLPPSSTDLKITYGKKLDQIKSISDEVIFHPVKYKVLFGSKADTKLQATFKVVKNVNKSINDNDLKVRIVNAIDTFFDINNWDFGETFYFSELSAYLHTTLSPNIASIIIVPSDSAYSFGTLYQINSEINEIIISAATVNDVEVISAITAAQLNQTLAATSVSGLSGIA